VAKSHKKGACQKQDDETYLSKNENIAIGESSS